MQVRVHPGWGLAGDFDGVLQDALGNDVALRGGCWLRADEDAEILVALTVLLQLLLQGTQPLGHQVDVLEETKGTRLHQFAFISTCAECITGMNGTCQGYALQVGTCPISPYVPFTASNISSYQVNL